MQFSDLYNTQLNIELGSSDTSQLFTAARRKKAINDAMHNFERQTSCTPVYGSIAITMFASNVPPLTTVSAGGTGYSVNDVLTVSGGTNTVAAQFTVSAVSGGVVTAITRTTAGSYTVLPSNPASVTGGTGANCTLTVQWAGTSEYDLLGNFSNYIRLLDREQPAVKMVDGSGNVSYIQGDDLPRRTPHMLDQEQPGWLANSSGNPSGFYIRNDSGKTYVGLTPPPLPPASWTWTLRVPYLASSTDMVADGDIPFTVGGNPFNVLVPYHQALVHYAAGLLEHARKNYSVSQAQMALYAGYLQQFWIDKRKEGPSTVTYARNYFRRSSQRLVALNVDPHRFP